MLRVAASISHLRSRSLQGLKVFQIHPCPVAELNFKWASICYILNVTLLCKTSFPFIIWSEMVQISLRCLWEEWPEQRQPWTLIGSGGATEEAIKPEPSAHHWWLLHKNSEFIPSRPHHPSYSGYSNISRYEWGRRGAGSRQPSRLHTTQELRPHP